MTERIGPEQLTAEQQAFPRILLFEFHNSTDDSGRHVAELELLDVWPNAFPDGPVELTDGRIQGFRLPSKVGQLLTDNSVKDDGYRFHDALHIGVMAGVGWSPVMRSLLGIKRRADARVDEIDDGGRSIVLEESLFDYLGMKHVEFGNSVEQDISLSFAVSAVKYAIEERGTGVDRLPRDELTHALLEGAKLFHEVRRNLGGYALANLDNRTAMYIPKDPDTYISPQQALLQALEESQG